MFRPSSRYASIPDAVYHSPDGQQIRYKRRRFLPQSDHHPAAQTVRAEDHMRLDQVADEALGDPRQYWRICDANAAMHPLDMMAGSGRLLRVSVSHLDQNDMQLPGMSGADEEF